MPGSDSGLAGQTHNPKNEGQGLKCVCFYSADVHFYLTLCASELIRTNNFFCIIIHLLYKKKHSIFSIAISQIGTNYLLLTLSFPLLKAHTDTW